MDVADATRAGGRTEMTTKGLGRRVACLRRAGGAEAVFRFAVVFPESWPAAVQAAYEAAKEDGDQDRQADIVEAQTGRRPVFPRDRVGWRLRTPPIVEIRLRPDGPQ